MFWHTARFAVLLPLLWFSGTTRAPVTDLPAVAANDNTLPAGRVEAGAVRLHLTARYAAWYPEDPAGGHVTVAAFSEGDGPPMIPAPLIRVAEGTLLEVTVTNALPDSTITVMGLQEHPAGTLDSVDLAPGESRLFRFAAGRPGTYYYRASPGVVPDDRESAEREQLGGALVVDPAGAVASDRIFVMNIWTNPPDSAAGRPDWTEVLAINGRSWPWTERISGAVGDTMAWRWVNLSRRNHPMHLHGAFFRVDARGTGLEDTLYDRVAQREAVTEEMMPWSTMLVRWAPVFAGNWLFHCHIVFHVAPELHLPSPGGGQAHGGMNHMAGLTLGVQAHDRPGAQPAPRPDPERIRLVALEATGHGRAPRAMTYLRDPSPGDAAGPLTVPAPPLILERGRPTDVTVVNQLSEPTGVHWHGLELESRSDGVVGWSGSDLGVMRAVGAGDSFVAHLTLRRAGTFIYHTHLNDLEQLTSGLYGAIIVLEPGQAWDPSTDHVYVAGWDGSDDASIPQIVINGDSLPGPDTLAAGVPHRFRFVNIAPAGRVAWVLRRDGVPVSWRVVAKDGMTLPGRRAVIGSARTVLDVGETMDFEIVPEPGVYTLDAGLLVKQGAVVQTIVVR